MGVDSANSYEQRTWKYYAESHARAKRMIEIASEMHDVRLSDSLRKHAFAMIARAEEKYPCLKRNITE